MKTIFLAVLVPSALPALRVAGALFLIVNLLAGAWAWRHRRQLFGPDLTVAGDRVAVRQLQAIVLAIPWLFITFRLLYVWIELWIA
jgi:membrane-anchored protein YejM (alkaline phosphatase superfamily)